MGGGGGGGVFKRNFLKIWGGEEDFQSNFLIIMGGVIAIPKLRVGYRSENFKGN